MARSTRSSRSASSGPGEGLGPYRNRRRFDRTTEPRGAERDAGGGGRRFVVQRHAARSLHYDLRLELEGVLKSWAVPKGPSTTPGVCRLAMQVEDHPLEYGDFEGTIPEGEYGAGTVVIWDRGTWRPEDDARRGLEDGKLAFELEGARLRGRWTLVRMRSAAGGRASAKPQWLLVRAADTGPVARRGSRAARGGVGDPSSATPRRSPGARRTSSPEPVPGARRAAPPAVVRPQLATLVTAPPSGSEWAHEIKLDGYRILALVAPGRVELRTRNGLDWTTRFPTIAKALRHLPARHAVLDGEVVAVDEHGVSQFQLLQRSLRSRTQAALRFELFDILHRDGHDLTGAALLDRKAQLRDLLEGLPKENTILRFCDHVLGRGPPLLVEACRRGLEGIVSKRASSPYVPGRSGHWLKTKCLRQQEFVVVGFTEPGGSRLGFGALLLAVHGADGSLVHCGRVGTGFDDRALVALRRRLDRLTRRTPPLSDPPRAQSGEQVRWVEPSLVVEVRFAAWTADGLLRHPSFIGVREDKLASEVVRERPASPHGGESMNPKAAGSARARHRSPSSAQPEVRLTNPQRMLYPDAGITKAMLAEYYRSVAERLLPHVANRPLTILRCPQGQGRKCFYQRHGGVGTPDAVRTVSIADSSGQSSYLVVDDLSGLLALVQLGTLELHPWGCRSDDVERAERLVFDLDPGPGVKWGQVVDAARAVRAALEGVGLRSFVQTSGGKGLHVVLPLRPAAPWPRAKEFARAVARAMESHAPRRYVSSAIRSRRTGRIFIDYLRNDRGATSVAPYSTRARPGAPVAMPLSWRELGRVRSAAQFTVGNVARRMRAQRTDPWEGYFALRQGLPEMEPLPEPSSPRKAAAKVTSRSGA